MNQNQGLVTNYCETEIQETRRYAWEDGLSAAPDVRADSTDLKQAHFNKLRSSLVLKEQHIHGDLGPTPDYLRGEIDRHRVRLSEIQIPGTATSLIAAIAQVFKRWWRARQCHSLKVTILRLEDQLSRAVLRRTQADCWIETHEQFLHAEYDIQRTRAARAANRLHLSELSGGSHVSLKQYAVR